MFCQAEVPHAWCDSGKANEAHQFEQAPQQIRSGVNESEDSLTSKSNPDEEPRRLAEQAAELVYGDRQGAYGHPADDYGRTASMWSAFLGLEISPAQAALMMVLLKLSREMNRPKDDNIVDAHGYLMVYGRIRSRA